MKICSVQVVVGLSLLIVAACGGSDKRSSRVTAPGTWQLQAGKDATPVPASYVDGGFDVVAVPGDTAWVFGTANGNFVLTAQVGTVPAVESAGLLVRDELLATGGSYHYASVLIHDQSITINNGNQTSGSGHGLDWEVTGGVAPRYLRLERAGDLFTIHYSVDGTTWDTFPQPSVEQTMSGTAFVGVFVQATASVRFDHVEIAAQ